MIGIWDRDPDGYSPYIIICLIQPRSRSRCEKWGIFKSRLIASKSLPRYDIPYALHVHVADFPGNFRNGEVTQLAYKNRGVPILHIDQGGVIYQWKRLTQPVQTCSPIHHCPCSCQWHRTGALARLLVVLFQFHHGPTRQC